MRWSTVFAAIAAVGAVALDDAAAELSRYGLAVAGVNGPDATRPRYPAGLLSFSDDTKLVDIVQTPPAAHWGRAYSTLIRPVKCTPSRWVNDCDPDFLIKQCRADADCNNVAGSCRALRASVTGPAETAAKLCLGHSEILLETIYDLIANAKQHVDITTLAKPDAPFLAAITNAITYNVKANAAARRAGTVPPLTVRMLVGTFPAPYAGDVKPSKVIKQLTAGIAGATNVSVHVAKYQVGVYGGWNHSKIVAVDGTRALVGGHNMFSWAYLEDTPAHDLSIVVEGGAANNAHLYANKQWEFTCGEAKSRRGVVQGEWAIAEFPAVAATAPPAVAKPATSPCPLPYAMTPARGTGTANVFGIGRLSDYVDESANPSDQALLALIGAAQTEISIAQQQFLLPIPDAAAFLVGAPSFVTEAPALVNAIAEALERNVKVKVVVGSASTVPTGFAGSRPMAIVDKIKEQIDQTAFPTALCNLTVAPIRFSTEENPYESWFGRNRPGNHSKLLMIDRKAFYVGSQNLYPSENGEFGFVFDDQPATQRIFDEYWTPLWTNSSRLAVSAAECAATASP